MTALPPDVVDDLSRENARLHAELRAAREREAGSAEILHTIGNVSGDAEQSLYQIAETTKRLFEASSATIFVAKGNQWGQIIHDGASSQRIGAIVPVAQLRIGGHSLPAAAYSENRQIHLPDIDNVDSAIADWPGLRPARAAGTRTLAGTPLRHAGRAIGVLIVHRDRLVPFSAEELALLQNFADQAAIAIENARLFNNIREARDGQNASAEILRTIASAPGDAERSLQQIAEITARLFDCQSVRIRIAEDGEWVRTIAVGASAERVGAGVSVAQARIGERNLPGTVVLENRQVHIPDLDNLDPAMADWPGLPHARAAGTRTMAGTPLRCEGKAIGVLVVYRDRLAPFTAEELALLQSFADQAVIAIENARLFNETREALERQTATADILKVIASSPSDVQPVFEAIAESAKRLAAGHSVTVTRVIDGMIHLAAFSTGSEAGIKELQNSFPSPLSSSGIHSRVARAGTFAFRTDMETEPDVTPAMKELARARGYRSILVVPMLREGVAIGTIAVTRRDPGRFADSVIDLLKTFADQAVIAIENTRLFNETKEALERQTATADILKVIASSPSDVQPVFEAIATSANRLIGGFSATVMLFVGDALQLVAFTPTNPTADEALRTSFPRPLAEFPPFELVRDGKTVQFPDTESEGVPPVNRELALLRGYRSMVFTPLMSKGAPIGILSVTRKAPGAFAAHHLQLLQTFADQAVIAIENVRLFNETQEALERQTATADILKVIASSPSDVQPVFEAIATSSNRLIGGFSTAVLRFVGDTLYLAAFTPTNPAADEALKASFPRPLAEFPPFELVRDGETVEFTDTESEDVPPLIRGLARLRGYRSMLFTPLMSSGTPIGMISVTRKEPGRFAENHVQLVRTFADQAVIAIENVRLFDEVQAKTRDLTEALTYQTGSSNILSVIASSPTDVGPVLKAIVESACELCDAQDATVSLREGNNLRSAAHHGPIPVGFEKRAINRGWVTGRAVVDKVPIHLHDVLSAEGDEFPEAQQMSRGQGKRTILGVPLLREGESIGAIVLRRSEVHPFSEKKIALLQNFADQAVIAIGNVRLFDEVQAKTRDLMEALQQQTATADVLKVISRSAFDLQTVFETLVESAAQLCHADKAAILRLRDNKLHIVATHGFPPQFKEFMLAHPMDLDRGSVTGRAALDRRTVHVPDILADPEFTVIESQRRGGFRTVLGVPLLREGNPIGALFLTRGIVELFTQQQIDLVTTFADQAVIAIENVRLFDEVQTRTRELSQSLEELRTAQDRLVQTEKLASLGQLTAGIAHEIKNPLNFVNNFAALSADLTDELNDVLKPATLAGNIREEVDELTGLLKDNLQKVVQHGKRADSIVKNMLLHSREGSGEHRPADINSLLDESLNLAYHGARAEKPQFNVTLRRDFDDMAGLVELFPQEITRVLLNLISNGFYAVTKRKMENGGPGFEPVLHAATRNLGDTVEIRIRDNGTGIPAEVREKMFNPFFTTKPAGEGTGLGLSMSHDIIVKQHGGRIDVETEPGQFTEFRIVLPRTSSISNKDRGQT